MQAKTRLTLDKLGDAFPDRRVAHRMRVGTGTTNVADERFCASDSIGREDGRSRRVVEEVRVVAERRDLHGEVGKCQLVEVAYRGVQALVELLQRAR